MKKLNKNGLTYQNVYGIHPENLSLEEYNTYYTPILYIISDIIIIPNDW